MIPGVSVSFPPTPPSRKEVNISISMSTSGQNGNAELAIPKIMPKYDDIEGL